MKSVYLFIVLVCITCTHTFAQTWNLNGNADATASSKLGTTTNQPLRFFANSAERMRIDSQGRVSIGSISANASTILQVNSTTQGVLVPRMTTLQKNAIVSPAKGLLIYQTDSTTGFYYFDGGWNGIAPSSKLPNKRLSNLTAPTALNQSLLPDSALSIDLGNKDSLWNNFFLKGDIFLKGNAFPFISAFRNASFNNCTAVGLGSLNGITSGSDNTAFGRSVLFSNTTGSHNTAYGTFSLVDNKSGSDNTAMGASTLLNNLGSFNTAMGSATMFNNTTGSFNTAIGVIAMRSNNTGSFNTAIGYASLVNNTTGTNNTASGLDALGANTTGSFNSAHGEEALSMNTTGSGNTANGNSALQSNTTGNRNTANGDSALFNNTTASRNCATGAFSLFKNANGTDNTANGPSTLFNNTSGFSNCAFGSDALNQNTTGGRNTAVGFSALSSNTAGSDNTAVGFNTYLFFSFSNSTALGASTTVTADNQARIGNTAVTSIGGFANWTKLSDQRFKENIKEDVPGIAFIKKLRPLTYTVNIKKLDTYLNQGKDATAEQLKAKEQSAKIVHTGFMAQEVEQAAKELNYNFSGVDAPKNDKDFYGLRYAEFVVPLVKAVQELSTKNEELAKKNETLEKNYLQQQKQIDELKEALMKLLNTKSISTTLK